MTRHVAMVVLAAVLFGTSGIAKGLGPDGIPAIFTGAWRTVVGGAALAAIAFGTGRRPPRRPAAAAIGALAVVVYQLAFFAALDRLGVATTVVVSIGTGPIVAGLLDAVLPGAALPHGDLAAGGPRRRRPTVGFVFGAVLAIVGVSLVSWPLGDLDVVGAAIAVIAGAAVPIYGASAQALMAEDGIGPLEAMATIFGAAAVLALPVAAWGTIDLFGFVDRPAAPATVAVLAWLGLAATGLAYWLWGRGLAGLPLSVVAVATMAEPAAATVLSWVVLGDPALATQAVGLAVICVAIVLVSRSAATPPPPDREPRPTAARGGRNTA